MRILFTLVLFLSGLSALRAQTCANRALDFDGTGDFVQSATAPVTGDANFTMEARFLCNSSGTAFRRLMAMGGTSTRIEIGEVNGRLAFMRLSSGGTAGPLQVSSTVIRNTGWHHVAVRRNAANITIFLDCDSIYSAALPGTLNISTFRVGSPAVTVTGTIWWDGLIDEVRVWNTVRTAAQINTGCDCSLAGNETGLQLFYDFDQSGIIPGGNNPGQTTAQDGTASNNDGTLNTFALTGSTSNWMCGDSTFTDCNNCPAAFTRIDSCNTIFFVNQTQQPLPPPYTYAWDFNNDGITDSTNPNPEWTPPGPGTYTVCLSLMTPNGVFCTTCQTIVWTGDTQPPVAICAPPFSVQVPAGGFVPVTVGMIDNGSHDDCSFPDLQINTNGFSCADACGPNGPVGNHVVILTATDLNGNTSTCSTLVNVVDLIPPTARCKAVNISINGAPFVVLQPSDVNDGSFDNCQITSLDLSQDTFYCPQPCPMTSIVVLTVTDCSGNIGTCTAAVTVHDVLAPSMICPPNVTIDCDAPLDPAFTGFPNIQDNCPQSINPVYSDNISQGNCPGEFFLVRVWVAEDACGNTALCSQLIQVQDFQAPVIGCPPNTTLNGTVTPNGCFATYAIPIPMFADNCSQAPVLTAFMTGGTPVTPGTTVTLPQGVTTITYVVTDDCGNTATCLFTVTVACGGCLCGGVVDVTPPVIDCPADISLNGTVTPNGCFAAFTIPPAPQATDNCSIMQPVVISISGTPVMPGSTYALSPGVTTVTCTATDDCGNTATCSYTVTVACNDCLCNGVPDVTPPLIANCPANISVMGSSPGATVSWTVPTATDNCQLESLSGTHDGAGFFPCGATLVSYVATDSCGNTSVCSFTVTVVCDSTAVCECGGFTGLHFGPVGPTPPTLSVACNQPFTVPCPVAGRDFTVSGQLACSGGTPPGCQGNVSFWILRDAANNGIGSGALNTGTSFSLTIDGDAIQTPGTYSLLLQGYCGNQQDGFDTCRCTLLLVVPDCSTPKPNDLCGKAVITCFPGFINNMPNLGLNSNAPTFAIVDIRDQSTATPGAYWPDASGVNIYHPSHWNLTNTGLVFGIAIDNQQNFYLSATTLYGCPSAATGFNPFGPAGAAGIYKVTPAGGISNFITTGPFNTSGTGTTIPNSGSGLGNICYDPDHDQFFATNFSDGMIYRIKNGLVIDRFDPFSTTNSASNDDPDFVTLDERTWAIGYNKKDQRVYFSRWREDRGRIFTDRGNEIWSIGINPTGAFNATNCGSGTCDGGDVPEIFMPDHVDSYSSSASFNNTYSNPVSDIAFSESGRLLTADRSMRADCGDATKTFPSWPQWYSHEARVLEYEPGSSGNWILTPGHATPPFTDYSTDLKFAVGAPNSNPAPHNVYGASASGGVDYGYESFDPLSGISADPACDQKVWMTGDYLKPASLAYYGMQGNDATGGSTFTGFLVDYDGVPGTQDKVEQGDVEIFKCKSCSVIPECDANCLVDLINMSTGYDQNASALLTNGSYDNDWTLISSPDPGVGVPTPAVVSGNIVPYAWDDLAGANYISAYPYALYNAANLGTKPAYVFENCFCVCDDSSVITIDLKVHVDNLVDIDLYTSGGTFIMNLLSVTSATSAAFTDPPATSITTLTLAKGTYCIRAALRNAHESTPMGLSMECLVSGDGLIRQECCSPSNSIVGEKYHDKNCNGDRGDPLIEAGLQGWEIQLCDTSGILVASTFTDAFGFYNFNDILPGTYIIKEVNQPGYSQSEPAAPGAYTVTIGENEVIGPFPFGNCEQPVVPCDSISSVAVPDTSGGCCYILKIENAKPNYFTAVGISVISGGTLGGDPQEFSGWSQQSFGSSVYFIPKGGGNIPVGQQDVTEFCIENITQDSQCIEVVYYAGSQIVCRDTLKVYCLSCVKATVDSAYCESWNQYAFDVCITAGEDLGYLANSVTIIPITGVDFQVDVPNITNADGSVIVSLPNLGSGDPCYSIPVSISGPVSGGQTICFYTVIHDRDLTRGEPDIDCCADTTPVCFVLPECDPCDSTTTFATYQQVNLNNDECCFDITLNNPPDYFVGVNTEILTPGWEFSTINNMPGSGWIIGTNSPPTSINWDPTVVFNNFVPANVTLPTLCFENDGSGILPIDILITWTAEDSTVCTYTLHLDCNTGLPPDECVILTSDSLVCTGDTTYAYTFTVYNNTDISLPAFTAGQVSLYQIPPGTSFNPSVFNAVILPGGSQTFTTTVTGHAGDQLCFYAVLHELNHDSLHINCCPTADTICITLPPCGFQCPNNLVQNGDFQQGMSPGDLDGGGTASFWSAIPNSTPQVVLNEGCAQNGSILMWGNQVVGEGIRQSVAFSPGATYQLSLCGAFLNTVQPNARLRVRATNNAGLISQGSYLPCALPDCEEIFLTPILTTAWTGYTAPLWTPLNPYTNLVVTVWNNSNVNSGNEVSWARVDDICIRPIQTVASAQPNVHLYPNPATDHINLAFDAPLPATATVRILDMTGRTRLRLGELPAGTEMTTLDISGLTDGMYVADIEIKGVAALRKRFVVHQGGVQAQER